MMSALPDEPDGSGLIAQWARAADGSAQWFAVPGDAGARVFRKGGWVGFRSECTIWATAKGLDPAHLAVVDTLPLNGRDAAARSTLPLVDDVTPEGVGITRLSLRIPFGLPIFAGHFPTVPIVPGAVLLGWASALAAQHLGWKNAGIAIPAVKFRRIVQPGLRLVLRLQMDASAQRLEFRYSGDGGLHAVGTLQVAEC